MGGIRNDPTGTLYVSESTISNNLAILGGGIYNNGGRVNIRNSTISGNQASHGAGIFNGGGIMNISFSTITLNETINTGGPSSFGGGILNIGGGVVNIGNTILAFNADNDIDLSLPSIKTPPVMHYHLIVMAHLSP